MGTLLFIQCCNETVSWLWPPQIEGCSFGGFYSSGLFSLRSPTEFLHIAKCEKSARHIPSSSCLLDRVHLENACRRSTGWRCWMSVHVVCVHEYTLTLSPGISTPEMLVRWGWGVLITPSKCIIGYFEEWLVHFMQEFQIIRIWQFLSVSMMVTALSKNEKSARHVPSS